MEEPRRLSFSWQGDPEGEPTVVAFTLEPAEEGTRLRLEHTGFRGLSGLVARLVLSRGWKKKLLSETPPSVLERMGADT